MQCSAASVTSTTSPPTDTACIVSDRQRGGLRPPIVHHTSRSCGDPSPQSPLQYIQPRSASYGGEKSNSYVDPTLAQLSEFEEIIEQMDKYWPRKRAPPPAYPHSQRPPPTTIPAPPVQATQVPRVRPCASTGIDEDLQLILDNMDPELLASTSPCGVKIEATPLPPSPNG